MTQPRWTNASVVEFARGKDPIAAIVSAARSAVIEAVDQGWKGPPFDPIALAHMRNLEVVARAEVADARTVGTNHGLRIEFNPSRSHGRMLYSIAHEIAHTLFPDCAKQTRHRATHEKIVAPLENP